MSLDGEVTKEIEANKVFDQHLDVFLSELRPELVGILGEYRAITLVYRKFICHAYAVMFSLGFNGEDIIKELIKMADIVNNQNKGKKKW